MEVVLQHGELCLQTQQRNLRGGGSSPWLVVSSDPTEEPTWRWFFSMVNCVIRPNRGTYVEVVLQHGELCHQTQQRNLRGGGSSAR